MAGILYVCATPIGNLEDITLRVLNILKEVDFIAAEDTRHTIKLLNHFEIKKSMLSCHEHNENQKSGYIIERILQGESCALVSDAGMPGISDPGEILIREAIKNGIETIVVPGASAFVSALVISGLRTDKFVFEGFLPHKKGEKLKVLEKLEKENRTIIFYESPHRLLDTLKLMLKALGDREVSVSRELTKKFEETVRGKISYIIEYFEAKEVRGEFVVVIEGNDQTEENNIEEIDVEEILRKLLDEGYTKKDAVKEVVKKYKLNKNEVYQKSLGITDV